MAYKNEVLVCGGTGCISSSSLKILDKMENLLAEKGMKDDVKLIKTGCFGLCAAGPIVIVYPEGAFYSQVQLEDVEKIVDEHIVGGKVVKELLYKEALTEDGEMKPFEEVPFYKKQERVALRNCGAIGAESIEDYLARDGYKALEKVLKEMSQEEVIDVVKRSGLRGRGGGGFPTGLKWEFTYKAQDDQKYVACNADEGDPGAFMDRSILEGDPHALVEAMAIAGYAVGANMGYVYVRAEYPTAVERLQIAIDTAREKGILGKDIFGTGFEFDMEIRLGAGAFVCGEETALINSIEGRRGMPRPRPPFPAVKGIWNKPTLLNNVETYANIPRIILNGPEWFAAMGTEKSKGTKVFALGGKVNNVGLVEIPMGTTLREIIFEVGGGIPNGKKFKAVQTGGPSGGCLTEEYLDTQIDYDTLTALGSMMGSGGMVVMDEDNCMVDIAKFFLDFTVEESCGKCPPCRIGTKRMLEILDRITEGHGELEDLNRLEKLANSIKSAALCGLGQTAPNPVLSTLNHFRAEYEAHVVDKKCPSGVCQELLQFSILEDKCKGCTLCVKACPVNAISGERKALHSIDTNACVKCGACIEKCPFKAIIKK
ncbi:NADH-quinone oxidoreductase subunit NuoF [Alkalithermobacter paradoxus]|uniref:NADP-reducing hydrogenase subunit HndC n=1 Tax=Alkalithermobacter paradoxus TaxID=29349 RepID=A0A1V4I526_9FIRM|nr:NADP-reducing hydrogenase subunit HndC [[Clostridium] thermoalcaliphilum]